MSNIPPSTSVEPTPAFARVELIRSDPWPLIVESISDSSLISSFSAQFSLPDCIVSEVFSMLQAFGFFDGRTVSLSPASQWTPMERIDAILRRSTRQKTEPLDRALLDSFFTKLSTFPVIQAMKSSTISKEKLPFGIFRFTSLFDIDIQRFTSTETFLEFLLINIEEQEQLFQKELFPSLQNNGWLPVDHIPEKSALKLDSWGFECMGFGTFFGQDVPMGIRMIPGFWPPGVLFSLSLSLPDTLGTYRNDTICVSLWIRFENKNGITIPVVHTIQNFLHNIGKDVNNLLIAISESDLNTGERFLDEWEKKKIKGLLDAYFWWNACQMLLACVSELLFEVGYPRIEIIDGTENLWLMEHNPNRSRESLEKSARELYQKNWLAIGGMRQDDGRVVISREGVVEFLADPSRDRVSQEFFSAYGRLSMRNKFRSIVDEIVENDANKAFIGNFIGKERERRLLERISKS